MKTLIFRLLRYAASCARSLSCRLTCMPFVLLSPLSRNAPRLGYAEAPQKSNTKDETKTAKIKTKSPEGDKKSQGALSAVNVKFRNSGKTHKEAVLFWDNQMWGKFGEGAEFSVNSFAGHKWTVKVGEDVVHTWTIEKEQETLVLG